MLLEAVEKRISTYPAPENTEVLSDNGSTYTAKQTRIVTTEPYSEN
jgi:hypothetical protein